MIIRHSTVIPQMVQKSLRYTALIRHSKTTVAHAGLPSFRNLTQYTKPIERPKELDVDVGVTSDVLSRLSTTHSFFKRGIPLHEATNECYEYYKKANKILLLDILQYIRINQQLLNFLIDCYPKSRSVRSLLLVNINQIILNGNDQVTMAIVWLFKKHNLLSPVVMDRVNTLSKTYQTLTSYEFKTAIGNIFIAQAATAGEPLLAASFALTLKDEGVLTTELPLLLRTLCIANNQKFAYNSYTILKLIEVFGVEFNEVNLIIDHMIQEKESAYFANITLAKLSKFYSHPEFLEIATKVMEKNIECGSLHKALKLWKKYVPVNKVDFVYTKHPALFKKMIIASMELEEQAILSEFIDSLPELILAKPDLIDQSLKYFGNIKQSTSQFELLVKQLQPPLNRLSLSVLFESFLMQNNEVAADRFLQTILNSKNGITYKDFNAIINKLLRQGKLDSCISMIKQSDVQISKKAYVSVLKYVLFHHVSTDLKTDFINNLISLFKKLSPSDQALQELTRVLMVYLLNTINNRLSRRLYETFSSQSVYDRVSKQTFSFKRFYIPDGMNSLIRVDGANRLPCLKIIGKRAVVDEDSELLQWTINEMRTVGGTLDEILACFHEQDSKFLRSLLKEQLSQSLEWNDSRLGIPS